MNKVDNNDINNARKVLSLGNKAQWIPESGLGIEIRDISYVHLVNLLKFLAKNELGISNLTNMAFINAISGEIINRGLEL